MQIQQEQKNYISINASKPLEMFNKRFFGLPEITLIWCKQAFQAVGDFFVSVGTSIGSFFSALWTGIKDTAVGVWNSITGFLSGACNTISSAAVSVFTGIGNAKNFLERYRRCNKGCD